MNLLTRPWRHYSDFKGRSRRLEYLFFWLTFYGCLFIWVFLGQAIALAFALNAGRDLTPAGAAIVWVPMAVFLFAAILPSIALSVRRLHDLGISGLWLLIWFVPLLGQVFGWLLSLVILFIPGPRGENQYGHDPHDPEQDHDTDRLSEVFA